MSGHRKLESFTAHDWFETINQQPQIILLVFKYFLYTLLY